MTHHLTPHLFLSGDRDPSSPRCLRSTRLIARSPNARAAALILVMWLLVIIGLLVLGLARTASVSASIGHGQVERVQARWLARAGVEQAIAELTADSISSDSQTDLWYDNPTQFKDFALAEGFTFRVTAPPNPDDTDNVSNLPRFGADDEASRVAINANRRNQLRRLPDITSAQVDAILDWIDGNENARPGGAERGHYSQLDFPYEIRNAPLRTQRELLLIKDIDTQSFFGEDGDLDGLLDRNENDADTNTPAWPDDNADRILDLGIAAYTSVYAYDLNTNPVGSERVDLSNTNNIELINTLGVTNALAEKIIETGRNARSLFDFVGLTGDNPTREELEDDALTNEITFDSLAASWEYITLEEDDRLPGKINVNTAAQAVLETVPGMSTDMAAAIIDHRAAQGAFAGVGDLFTTRVLTQRQFRRVAGQLTVRSNVFRIVSEGRTPSGTTHTIAVIVDRAGGGENTTSLGGAPTPVILDWRTP